MTLPFPIIVLRLTVAIVLGALIGLERETNEHTAGMRTNALVALGAALFTIISAYGFMDLLKYPHISLDPTRVASYVIAGIGFLGGGTIFFVQNRERVHGLTTASAIWVVAAVGMACGVGFLWEAIATTVLALIVLILLRFVERLLIRQHPSSRFQIRIGSTTSSTDELIGQIYKSCIQNDVSIENVNIQTEQQETSTTLTCRTKSAAGLSRAIGLLHSLPGVKAVEADIRDANRKDALNEDIAR